MSGERAVMLVRYGELALKGANRGEFERALVRSLRAAARRAGVDPHLRVTPGRIFVAAGQCEPAERDRLLASLLRVFGVVSVSPAVETAADWDAIARAAEAVARSAREAGAATFKVEVRRANKSFPRTSPEVARDLGAHLARTLDWPVDVRDPAATVHVEIRDRAYVYAQTFPGPGGLPSGTGGQGLLLLSGGIDSPVAGWLMAKRGLGLRACYFHSPPYTGEKAREKVRDLCRALAAWCGPVELHSVPFTAISEAIFEKGPDSLGTILMRRFMMRIAGRLAERAGARALITGESLGQVASQTVDSIAAIADAADRPVLRPLVGMDKTEIVDLARRIGTYDISIRPYLDCCSVFVPGHPATRPRIEACREAEARLDVGAMVDEAVAAVETERVEP